MSGVIVGLVVVMAIVTTGVAGAIVAAPGATSVLAAISAAYFLYLAVRIATAPPLSERAVQHRPPSFGGGLLLSLVNSKGYAAMVALFSGFVLVRERLALDAALKVAVLVAIMTIVDVAWLFAGAALTRFFRDPRTNRAVNVTFAVLLVASLAIALPF